MLFTSISPEAFDHKNISKDIHEMNDHIKNLLVNAPPSHEIPFDVLQEIRRQGGGLLAFQPYSDRAENRQIGIGDHKVMIRIIITTVLILFICTYMAVVTVLVPQICRTNL